MIRTKEYWLFVNGATMQLVRTDTGFIDVITGAVYSKHEFLQYAQGCQGHQITEEAYTKISEGQRTFEEDR